MGKSPSSPGRDPDVLERPDADVSPGQPEDGLPGEEEVPDRPGGEAEEEVVQLVTGDHWSGGGRGKIATVLPDGTFKLTSVTDSALST